MPAPVGLEQIKNMDGMGDSYPLRRKSDGTLGHGYIAPGTFRLHVCGCNVAGDPQDVLFIPLGGETACVIKAQEYGVGYEKSDEVPHP